MSDRPLRILEMASHGSMQRGGAVQMIRLARGLAERAHAVTALFNTANEAAIQTDQTARAARAGVRLAALKLDDPQAAEGLRALWRQGGF
ncbi:MAG: hypothetical protein M1457_00705, partial [bacterium]|nr:hypothetical protein [bacterium]